MLIKQPNPLDLEVSPVPFCYFYDHFCGGETSSDLPLIVTHEVRLSHTFLNEQKSPLNLVVQAAIKSSLCYN